MGILHEVLCTNITYYMSISEFKIDIESLCKNYTRRERNYVESKKAVLIMDVLFTTMKNEFLKFKSNYSFL